MREEFIQHDVYEIEARIRLRFRGGNLKEAGIERERFRSYVEKLNAYTRRKLHLEVNVVALSEPVHVGQETESLRRTA